ncbi:MAG TPA: thiamine pyrophosphate-binding protein [Bacillota bacterium]|nr:thiamine pyrophosphate-binding protein [Bacillota bacterium]HPT86588.1 thiamine pyrophosphate-binding protein [Bacillota bacterium]
MNIAQWIIAQLSSWGVRSIYGVPGDAILPLIDALTCDNTIRFYAVRHETAAALMASAEAKLTGELSVCIATSGPGAANLINGLADAKNDRVPVLAITGQVDTSQLGTDTKQYINQSQLLSAVVSYSGLVTHAAACPEVFAKALRMAVALGTVVHIEIPANLWNQSVDTPIRTPEPYLKTTCASDPTVLGQLIDRLNQAERPAILAGRGIQYCGLNVIELAEKWQAGIGLSLPAKGYVPGNHPLVLGGLGEGGSEASRRLFEEADIILILGSTWWPKPFVPSSAQIIQIDADPLNIGRMVPVAFGAVGDLSRTLSLISQSIHPVNRTHWINRLHLLRQEWEAQIAPELLPAEPIPPGFLIKTLENSIVNDAVIAVDVGNHTVWFNRIFTGSGQTVLVSGNWRTMGFGLPAALSAQIARPGRQVIALVGDGSFAQSMAEFSTAVRYQLPITVIIMNNGWLAMERDKMELKQMNSEALSLTNPDFAQYAEICGGRGFSVTQSDQLATALQEALGCNRPAIVDVKTAAPLFPGLLAKTQLK